MPVDAVTWPLFASERLAPRGPASREQIRASLLNIFGEEQGEILGSHAALPFGVKH